MRLYPGIRAGPYIRKHPLKYVSKISLKISVLMVVGHLNSLIWPFCFIFFTLFVLGNGLFYYKNVARGVSETQMYIISIIGNLIL